MHSTTYRCRSNLSLLPILWRAMRSTTPRARHSRRAIQRRRPYWRAVCLDGVATASDDQGARWGGIEGGAIITRSCRLAPFRQKPSGVPRASATRWRSALALPQFVGFGHVAAPSLMYAQAEVRA